MKQAQSKQRGVFASRKGHQLLERIEVMSPFQQALRSKVEQAKDHDSADGMNNDVDLGELHESLGV